jgi:hypothetical protein
MKMNAFHPEIPVADRLSVVVLTHNRATEVVCSLSRLRCLETGPPDLARQPELVAVKALRAIYRLDVIARRARSEESIERARISGIVPGRRPTFSKRDPRRKSVNVSEILSTDTATRPDTMHIAPVSASGQRRQFRQTRALVASAPASRRVATIAGVPVLRTVNCRLTSSPDTPTSPR